jgi:hypothetical protein
VLREPAADIPPGPILAEAPLYPGAGSTVEEQPRPFFTCPGTPYLKSGFAAYVLPAGRDEAMAWYLDAMPEWGYKQRGSGKFTDHGEVPSMGLHFTSLNLPELNVHLSFQALDEDRTHVLYAGIAETLPPRPPESYLEREQEEVAIVYRQPFADMPTDRKTTVFTVSDSFALHDLVKEINALTDIAAGIDHGGLPTGESATLTFRTRDGRERTVEVRYGRSVTVGDSRPLVDLHMRVWAIVARLVREAK